MVTTTAPPQRYTVDDLAQWPEDGHRRELVDGQIVEWELPNYLHGLIAAILSRVLGTFVLERRLGQVVTGDSLVRILDSQYHARGPDVAFYARGHIPKDLTEATTGVAPDLVIEIFAPSDRAVMVQRKVADWLRAGVRLLWYIDPETGQTTVYHNGAITIVEPDEVLDGADVVPGFALRMRDVLEEICSYTETETPNE